MTQKQQAALPRHIGIIMDGNGRWAKQRGLPRKAGHRAGAQTFREIVIYCRDLGIDIVTVYAFSTENWKRPKDEVDSICALLEDYIKETGKSIAKERVRIRFLGDPSPFSPKLQQDMKDLEERTAIYTGLCLNIGMNYGGRDELTRAMQKIAHLKKEPHEITQQLISDCLDTAGQADPDLIIRPSGEQRLSNFLLWQAAYSEFWFSGVLWPDFKAHHLDQAILEFQRRNRRFGDV